MRVWWEQRTTFQKTLTIIGSLLLVAGLVVLCAVLPLSSWDFRNNLWGPAHLLLTGRSPYRIDQLFDGSNSVWMPTSIGAFSLLGVLTLGQATTLWGVAALSTMLVIVVACTRASKPAPIWLAAAVAMVWLFPPYVTHVGLGQFSVFAIFLAMLSADFLERRAPLWGVALCLLLLVTKPQLAPLVGIGVLTAVAQREGMRGLLRLGGWGGIFALLCLAPLFLLFPSWFDGLLWAFGRNATWLQPSSYYFLASQWGVAGMVLWGILVIGALALTVWLWRRYAPRDAVLWTLALTVLVTPYVWSYDFVLLLPLLIYTLFGVTWVLPRLVLIGGYGAIWGYFVHLRLASSNSDDAYWWVPVTMLALILLCWGISRLHQPDVKENAGMEHPLL